MGERAHQVTPQALDSYEKQFRTLHKDWHYLYKLLEAYVRPNAERDVLEGDFLRLKGKISCDYPVLTEWRNGGFGAPAGIGQLFADNATLKSMTESMRDGGGRAWDEWQVVDEAIGKVRQALIKAREKAKPGKSIALPGELFVKHATAREVDDYDSQFTSFQADWRRVYSIVNAYVQPGADRKALEMELIQLKSKISCEYPTLPRWFGGRDELSCGIGRFLSEGASLEALAQGVQQGGRAGRDWSLVDRSIANVRRDLGAAREQIRRGKSISITDDYFVPPDQRAYPWHKLLIRVALVGAAAFIAGTAWVSRNFLGVGAPEAGAGIVESASMEDSDKVISILSVMNESFVQGSVDMFMTTIANDFEDDAGNGRRALRVVLQTYHTAGNFQQAWVDWSQTEITRSGDWLYASPVIIRSRAEGEDDLFIRLGLKEYKGRWLIASGEGYN